MPRIISQPLAKCYPSKRRGFKLFAETIKFGRGLVLHTAIAEDVILSIVSRKNTEICFIHTSCSFAVTNSIINQLIAQQTIPLY